MTIPTIGSIVTCFAGDRFNVFPGEQYTVRDCYRRDPKLPVMIYLEGHDKEFAPFRFRKPEQPQTWQRPDTSDLEPSAEEQAAFEAARERAMKAMKGTKP